jgi:hypothetical protein
MARTLKQLKETQKRKLVKKPTSTVIPHMRVNLNEDVVVEPVVEPVVQQVQEEPADDLMYAPATPDFLLNYINAPYTPPTMEQVTVCPNAPVKPKQLNNIEIPSFSLASAMLAYQDWNQYRYY